jgi:hypothetical protein
MKRNAEAGRGRVKGFASRDWCGDGVVVGEVEEGGLPREIRKTREV